MHMQNLVKFHQFFPKLSVGHEIPTSIKGHSSVIYLRELVRSNPNLDVFNINAYARFGQIPATSSQDVERKLNSDINRGL